MPCQHDKGQKYMIVSADAEKAFNKIPHPLVTEILNKLGTGGNFLHLIEDVHRTAVVTLMPDSGRLGASLKIRSTATSVQRCTRALARGVGPRKEITGSRLQRRSKSLNSRVT